MDTNRFNDAHAGFAWLAVILSIIIKQGFKMYITSEFISPAELKEHAHNQYTELLKQLHKKIGYENLTQRLDSISLEWAEKSGYYMRIERDGDFTKYIFKHVSL